MADRRDEDTSEDRIKEAVRSVLQKHRGRSNSAIAELLDDAHKAREGRREARQELKEYKEKYPEGAVVLTDAQSKMLDRLKDIKIENLDTLEKDLIGKLEEVQGTLTQREQDLVITRAADLAAFPEDTLKDLIAARKLTPMVETRSETVDGKKVSSEVAMVKGEDGKAVSLIDYITEHAPVYESLLGSTKAGTPGKKTLPQSHSAGKAGNNDDAKSIVEQMLERNRKAATAPNPLRPAATT